MWHFSMLAFTSNISFLIVTLTKLVKTKLSQVAGNFSQGHLNFTVKNYIKNKLLWTYLENVPFIIVHGKTTTQPKIYDSRHLWIPPPKATLLRIFDFDEKFANIFNNVVCLACMTSDTRARLVLGLSVVTLLLAPRIKGTPTPYGAPQPKQEATHWKMNSFLLFWKM